MPVRGVVFKRDVLQLEARGRKGSSVQRFLKEEHLDVGSSELRRCGYGNRIWGIGKRRNRDKKFFIGRLYVVMAVNIAR